MFGRLSYYDGKEIFGGVFWFACFAEVTEPYLGFQCSVSYLKQEAYGGKHGGGKGS